MKPGPTHFQNTIDLLQKIGYTPADLTPLNVVHVAGTKGKGSVCAYVSSILNYYRQSGSLATEKPLKVGLFTSPHLVSVRERIRIDGAPIPKDVFAKYFYEVWTKLGLTKEYDLDPSAPERPPYFRFLTLMSFHAFLSEGVNAAVYEVGVGGEYDSTNIISHPLATGISKLGIDHVATLGHTIEEISWHKAGILKEGARVFTVPQIPAALGAVKKRAEEKGVDLQEVAQDRRLEGIKILPNAKFQRENASLAIALTEVVVKKLDPSVSLPSDKLPAEFVDGLEKVVWRGRCETIDDKDVEGVKWFIDGAHTEDSLKVAGRWWLDAASIEEDVKKVLIFNQQGRDTASELLKTLHDAVTAEREAPFTNVIFCTNTTYRKGWKKDMTNIMQDAAAIENLTVQKEFGDVWKNFEKDREQRAEVHLYGSIEEAIFKVRALGKGGKVECLVTGSLHLVGGVLSVLEGDV